jgi:hypothetical protein
MRSSSSLGAADLVATLGDDDAGFRIAGDPRGTASMARVIRCMGLTRKMFRKAIDQQARQAGDEDGDPRQSPEIADQQGLQRGVGQHHLDELGFAKRGSAITRTMLPGGLVRVKNGAASHEPGFCRRRSTR